MKEIIINTFLLFFILSCGSNNKDPEVTIIKSPEVEDSIKFESQINNKARLLKSEPQYHDTLLSFFNLTQSKSLKVTVKNDLYPSYDEEDEIPFRFQSRFDGYLTPMGRFSTGYIAKNYFEINDSLVFLILFIQDDYGPVYHGLEYNPRIHEIRHSQILAREWGDAGDSQTIYSELLMQERSLRIKKFISTCYAELDLDSDPIRVTSEECYDSTYVRIVK